MKILIRSTSNIYGGYATKNINNEIKVVVCRLPENYAIKNCPKFSSFAYDSTNTLYQMSSHSNRWYIIFDIFTPKDNPDRRYHTELYKLLCEVLKIPLGTTMPEYRFYFTKNVCTTNQAEQFNDYKSSCGSGFSMIHNILLPKALEYYS